MKIKYTSQFKKDYKRIKRENKDLTKFQTVIEKLASGEKLASKDNDHGLKGSLKGYAIAI